MAGNTTIVVDTGSGLIKAGLAGNPEPSVTFPNVIGTPKSAGILADVENEDFYIGDKALDKLAVLSLRYPVQHGIVQSQSWDDMKKIWRYTFDDEVKISPEGRKLLFAAAPSTSKSSLEQMTSFAFEDFSVSSLCIAPQPFLALQASGLKTGLVVDIGFDCTYISAVSDGSVIPSATSRVDIGGSQLTKELMTLLSAQGYAVPPKSDPRIYDDMKKKVCYVAQDYEHEMEQTGDEDSQSYELPDGTTAQLGDCRFRTPEVLFSPKLATGLGNVGIHEAVQSTIKKSDIDIQKMLYENVVLCGGTSGLLGLNERMQSELAKLAPASISVKVSTPENPEHAVWIGGSQLAQSPAFEEMCINRDDYEEEGPSAGLRKFPWGA